MYRLATLLFVSLFASRAALADSYLIRNGAVLDGTGGAPQRVDVRIEGDRIAELGRLKARPGEKVIDAKGLVVAPGFIDAHSHAPITAVSSAELTILQGITTAVVGQDGSHAFPLSSTIAAHAKDPTLYNVASFVGHGTVRRQVTGEDSKRKATTEEIAKMAALVEQEMGAGALGLSSGLEYDPGYYASTEELIACAKAAARRGGLYISHLRNEDNTFFEALEELIRIAREAECPAQISHIKLGAKSVWGRAPDALRRLRQAREQGVDIRADVYPYRYWQSSITVLIPTRDWSDREAWKKGLETVGGPENVLLTRYDAEKPWEGRTIAEIAKTTGMDAVAVIQEIVRKTHGPGATGTESVVVEAMREDDLVAFLCDPNIMFCSDGSPGGSHPRGAGSYPRILGRYVREQKALTLEEAIRKMTYLPAARMGLTDRGTLLPGMKADVVIFDPNKIIDRATTAAPALPSEGMRHVFVNGTAVLADGKPTGAKPGRFLLKPGRETSPVTNSWAAR